MRSSPNNNRFDNYSTQGNTNPYTGERGYQDIVAPRQPSINTLPDHLRPRRGF